MAYVIGKKIVKDTKEFDSYAYGITLPVKRGEGGFFEQSFTSFDQAKSNLKNLLLTRKGERIMQPNFGTGLHSLLFEQADDNLEARLEQTITENVNYWLPYITIKGIDVEMTNELKDQNKVNMSLQFTVGNQIDLQEITFTVQGTN
jgi:phage baseplate assembly protein W